MGPPTELDSALNYELFRDDKAPLLRRFDPIPRITMNPAARCWYCGMPECDRCEKTR